LGHPESICPGQFFQLFSTFFKKIFDGHASTIGSFCGPTSGYFGARLRRNPYKNRGTIPDHLAHYSSSLNNRVECRYDYERTKHHKKQKYNDHASRKSQCLLSCV
jgi:hypothetical protein